jgi:hypothetical protein
MKVTYQRFSVHGKSIQTFLSIPAYDKLESLIPALGCWFHEILDVSNDLAILLSHLPGFGHSQ